MHGFRLPRLFTLLLFLFALPLRMPAAASENVIEVRGACALADAIAAANTDRISGACPAGRGPDTIRLSADIKLERELPPIASTISIEGDGYSISGEDQFRIFDVDRGGSLSIQDIVLTRGNARRGGAILNLGTVTINRALIKENEAYSGAAIVNLGDMRISQSRIAANRGNHGGAIENRGWLNIEGSSINDNVADMSGGIESEGATSRLVISNSTISGNRGGQYGGGISAFGTVILTHVTIVNNVSEKGGGIFRVEALGGLAVMRNSIVAGNTGGDCTVGLHEQVNSIIGDGSCDARMSGGPLLKPVDGHYAPAPGSPAIAAADPQYCSAVDQLGKKRPTDEPCDIGAIEAPTALSPQLPGDEPRPRRTPEQCTLAHQIIAANTDAPYGGCPAGSGADIIVYKGAHFGEPLPAITSDITIEGRGETIQPVIRDGFQLFEVLGGHLQLRNLTLSGGYSPWTGGMIAVLRGSLRLDNVTIRDSSAIIGGAIFNGGGDVTIVDSRFINNRAIDLGGWNTGWGGAIFNSGRLEIRNSLFSANEAIAGAAIINIGDGARLEITGSRFSSNTAVSMGGAVANKSGGLAYISQSLFIDNFVTGQMDYPGHPGAGGAVASLDEIHILNSTFTRNGGAWGGAIFMDHPKATLQHLTIVQNDGNGLYIVDHSLEGFFTLLNSLIAGNKGDDCWVTEHVPVIVMRGNLIEDGSCAPAIQADPLLPGFDPMRNIIPLQEGSPAIDAGDPDYCLPYDQLGRARPVGAGCDIGAIEYAPAN